MIRDTLVNTLTDRLVDRHTARQLLTSYTISWASCAKKYSVFPITFNLIRKGFSLSIIWLTLKVSINNLVVWDSISRRLGLFPHCWATDVCYSVMARLLMTKLWCFQLIVVTQWTWRCMRLRTRPTPAGSPTSRTAVMPATSGRVRPASVVSCVVLEARGMTASATRMTARVRHSIFTLTDSRGDSDACDPVESSECTS